MAETPESRRLALVVKDYGKSVRAFARFAEVHESHIRLMIKGDADLNYKVIRAVCLKLDYSADWFILGVGNKKRKGQEAKLITEIQMLRMELDIITKLNLKLQARMSGVELEYSNLKAEVETLKNK